jgi:hypothetical protein
MSHIRPLPLLRGVLLATCSGFAIAIAAPAVQAAPTVAVSYTYTLGGSPISFSDSSGTSVSIYPSDFDGQNSISGAHWGSVNGVFGTRSTGNGTYENTGSSSWTDTFTNTGPAPVSLVASFLIEQGQVSVSSTYGGMVSAGVSAVINVNGSPVFSSFADMSVVDGGLATLVKTGTDLAPGAESLGTGGGSYYWGTYVGSIDLGLVAPNASVNIDYILASYANSTAGCDIGDSGGYGYCPTSTGRIGDPINIGQSSEVAFQFSEVAVPEPGSMALLGAGLAGLAMRRRRAAKA